MTDPRPPHVGFVLEQALGHATHAENLIRLVAQDERIRPEFAPIAYEPDPRWARVPGYGNWTVRAGIRARRAVRTMRRTEPLAAMFVHTQVPAMLMPDRLWQTPTVVSLDATPAQYDAFGDHYDHSVGNASVEQLKRSIHQLSFNRAALLVAWSKWTRADLIDRYGVAADKIIVLAPGVDRSRWTIDKKDRRTIEGSPVRVLFVGGNLVRKGGTLLIEAVRQLRSEGVGVELDLVTGDQVDAEPGIAVHRGLTPNSPELMQLFRDADIFCLPTLADCLAIVLPEAGMMRIPLVATDVGATSEIVIDDETGLLLPPGDERALVSALRRLVADPTLRERLSVNAERLTHERHDASTNARVLVDVLLDVARR